jgi:hypothetical protein
VTRTFYTQSNRDNIMAFGDFTVTRASTKNILGSAGLYVSVANNVPAFEFNTDGSYRGLLVEPGATNLALQSQAFNEAVWSKTDTTVTANSTVSPDGTTTGDTLTEGTAGTAGTAQAITVSSGATVTFSSFFKYSNQQWLRMRVTFGSDAIIAFVDIQNGVAGSTSVAGTGVVGSVRVENYGNGWYRCSLTGSLPGNTTYSATFASATADGNATRVNNSVYIAWQAQLETGSVATSPIVTTAGTASRVADVVSLTGASSLIGQDSGWVGVSLESGLQAGVARSFARLTNDASATILDGVIISKSSTDQVQLILRANNAEVGRRESATNQSGKLGIVVRYDESGSTSLHVNGATISTILTTAFTFANTIPVVTLGSTQNGTAQLNGHMRAYTQGAIAITEAQANALSLSLSQL